MTTTVTTTNSTITRSSVSVPLPAIRLTQFEAQVLPGSDAGATAALTGAGRAMVVGDDGLTYTALPLLSGACQLLIWRDHELTARLPLTGSASMPCWTDAHGAARRLWISVEGVLHQVDPQAGRVQRIEPVLGYLLDAARDRHGRDYVLLSRGGPLVLACLEGERLLQHWDLPASGLQASIALDDHGRLHIVTSHQQALHYLRLDSLDEGSARIQEKSIVAEPYGFFPQLLLHDGQIWIAYLGESCRARGDKRWQTAWQRLGRGGYVALLTRSIEGGTWQRFSLADSQQISMRYRPSGETYGGGPHDPLITRIEEFSAPTLSLGPDGVPTVLWANVDRRWIYASRALGSMCSPAVEVRGPLEALTGPVLAPRTVPASVHAIPITAITQARAYLDALALPPRVIDTPRQIDFLQWDELASVNGLEQAVQEMARRPENPMIPKGRAGEFDEGGVVSNVFRDGDTWRAEYMARHKTSTHNEFPSVARARSDDGIHWTKLGLESISQWYTVDGVGDHRYPIRYLEDPQEPDPTRRFKGFWRDPKLEPWGWSVIVSPDGQRWTKVPTPHVVRADDDLVMWIDEADVPARRWKANAIGRSHCGRVAAMWWSADGVNWVGERQTLDLAHPFSRKPLDASTGHIIVDAWAGPPEEDELHGGFLFREGQRLLCHYMKWTPDGHIWCGLACSWDGMNFSRVAGGATTLGLGAPGQWDAGRVAIREAPFLVGQKWRQYYIGCGWKHGLAGVGAKTSPWGVNGPNQTGAAEIEIGRWAGLQVRREAKSAHMTTITLDLKRPCRLTLNVTGLDTAGAELRCGVRDVTGGRWRAGQSPQDADRLQDGFSSPVTWNAGTLQRIEPGPVRIHVTLNGWGLKLHALQLTPCSI